MPLISHHIRHVYHAAASRTIAHEWETTGIKNASNGTGRTIQQFCRLTGSYHSMPAHDAHSSIHRGLIRFRVQLHHIAIGPDQCALASRNYRIFRMRHLKHSTHDPSLSDSTIIAKTDKNDNSHNWHDCIYPSMMTSTRHSASYLHRHTMRKDQKSVQQPYAIGDIRTQSDGISIPPVDCRSIRR